MKGRDAGVQGAARRFHRPAARRAGAVIAGLLVVAGTTTVFDASAVLGSAPPSNTPSCNDNWVGSGTSGDWNSAANWSTGVPNGADVSACIAGNADVTLTDVSSSIGALTVSAGSSLTIGAGTTSSTPSLSVSSGLQNSGSLTVDAAGTSGHPGLSLNGPITNSGTITVDGTMAIGGVGAAAAAVQNDGTIGVAPGGLVDGNPATTITNDPTGVLAFGIDGPPGTLTAYGRITGSALALGGTADPVDEDGFSPPAGSEYVVGDGPSTGAFATVSNGATADSSHAGQLGLIGGAPATPTVTHVTSSVPAGSLFGQPVGLTAVVTPATGTGPTGSVSFFAGGLLLGSSPVTTSPAGVTSATVTTARLPAPGASITASYDGDVLFGASTSTGLDQIVNPDPTTLTITPSVPSPEAGQSVTDTATVTPTSQSPALPTGTVSFTDDGSPVPGCQSLALPAGAPLQAACTESFGSGATHTIVADYDGDVDNAGSTATLAQTVGQLPTVTAVTSSTPSTVYGQIAVVTATITPSATAAADPGGTVTFWDGSLPLGTADVSDDGGTASASLDTSSLVEGAHFVTATYSGDPTYATSTTPTPVTLDVAEAPTTVTVDDASSQSVVGQTVVLTASIASPVPGMTGTVQFADDGDPIGSGTVSGGQATFETSSLALGVHAITALYEGDDNFIGGSSTNTVTQTVGRAATSTEVTSAHDPGLVGQTIVYTATVAVATPGSGTPTGTASFSDGGDPVPGCQGLALSPAAPLVVTCPQTYDTTAGQDITVAYSGDANFSASTGALTENVSPVSTTTALVPSPAAATSGQSLSLTATVSPTSGTASPDGSVTFILDGSPLGTSVVSTTDGVSSASMLLTTLPVGSDSVTATYGGSSDFLGSTADATSVVVTKASTALGLLAATDTSTAGTPTTLTADVFPATGSGATGTVTFFDNGVRIGTSPVTNGQATLTVFDTLAADTALTADYTGDSNFISSATPGPVTPGT